MKKIRIFGRLRDNLWLSLTKKLLLYKMSPYPLLSYPLAIWLEFSAPQILRERGRQAIIDECGEFLKHTRDKLASIKADLSAQREHLASQTPLGD